MLECIHSDIWGPYSIPTINGHVFKIYKVKVENQLNRRIKNVRSDRGGEYYGRFTESGQHLSVFALFLESMVSLQTTQCLEHQSKIV